MSGNESLFQKTLSGLEAGLQVELIAASPLETCDVNYDAMTVLADARFRDFTCIPARRNGQVVGVFERSETPVQGTIEQCMRPLDGSMLISAGASLTKLIPLLEQSSYRLVVTERGIEGIVTRSDLQKLPVRLYVFTLITHLETVMAAIIQKRIATDQEWKALLSENRQAKIEEKRQQLRSTDSDLPLLELTDFCDKRDILAKLLRSHQGFSRRAFEKDLKDIEDLRNTVAHAASYADDGQGGQDFIACLKKTRSWIETLPPYLEAQPSTEEPARILQPAPILTKE